MCKKEKYLIKSSALSFAILGLSACQSMPSSSQVNQSNGLIEPKTTLTKAIEHTLYRNQDWVVEHQLYFVESPDNPTSDHDTASQTGILGCQQRHDDALVKQMQQDHLKTYAQVAKLDETKKLAYDDIKQTYLACYRKAETQIQDVIIDETIDNPSDKSSVTDKSPKDEKTLSEAEAAEKAAKVAVDGEEVDGKKIAKIATTANQTDTEQSDTQDDTEVPDIFNQTNSAEDVDEKKSVIDEIEPISDLRQTLSIIGLNDEQVKSINTFVAKSGKVITTGNYRPFSGFMAVQIDAGFENKNLKYHYRLPMVANWKTQTVYVKPDIIMPMVALYLDNKMGMDWQNNWYKFNPAQSQKLPLSLATKYWVTAFKESVKDLPAGQFKQVNTNELTPNIAYARQKIVTNGTIIHWQQSAKEQQALYRDIIKRYIALMDQQIGEKTDKNANQYQAWQTYKKKLTAYVDTKLTASDTESDSQPLNQLLTSQSRLNGQNVYFVLNNGQVKQVFANNPGWLGQKQVQVQTWITFDPDSRLLNVENRPETLLKLASQIHDGGSQNNVLDGQKEIERIINLDSSRRLFGKDPAWLDVLKRLQKNRSDKPAEQDY